MKPSPSTVARGGQLLFALLFVLFAAFLLSVLSEQTRFSAGKQLFSQPRFWPGAAVVGMLVFGIAYLCSLFGSRAGQSYGLVHEFAQWLKSIEYFVWFMAYVFAVPIIGYLPTTLFFMLFITLRLGYRSRKIFFLALLVGFVVVLTFKAGLSVSIPGGAIYEHLPKALRNFMISNF